MNLGISEWGSEAGVMVPILLLGATASIIIVMFIFKDWLRFFQTVSQSPALAASVPLHSRGEGTEIGSRASASRNKHSIEVTSKNLRDCRPEEWDAFAQECNASFQSACNWLRGWSMKSFLRRQLRLYELHQSGRKIGQCAIGFSANERIFLDRIALKPGFEELWADCMIAILERSGTGRYRYGWHLTLEQSRDADIRSLPGVSIESVRPITVHAVDFCLWPTWDKYWASTSSNTRRNAKRAEQGSLNIDVQTGLACILHMPALARLRSAMYGRKGIRFHRLTAMASHMAGHVVSPQYRLSAIVTDGLQTLAGFSGYEFGRHTYYLAGGSVASNNGAAWYLQKSMLQRAWELSQGRAKFIMGHVDYATHDEAVGGGLLRSRRAVNASEYPTSIVSFLYER